MKGKFSSHGIRLYRVSGDYPTRNAIQIHPILLNHLKSRFPPRIRKDDPETLLIYNKFIAADLYGLDMDFYPGAIIPTPIMRYNFLKRVIKPNSSILEIGTGASAIIAMLAAKMFHCNVTATEIDPNYIPWAEELITRNNLTTKIDLIKSDGHLIDHLIPPEQKFDYILSNPPYYDVILSPKNPWGGRIHELVSEGDSGESFILQLIREGWKHLNPCGILAFIVPKTRISTLNAIENFLQNHEDIWDYDIIGLLAGNRTRYVFRLHKHHSTLPNHSYEMF